MTDPLSLPHDLEFLQGRNFRPQSVADVADAIELAFDFRGDVTLELTSGELLEGYVFNRRAKGESPSLDFFPGGKQASLEIFYRDIVGIAFTGEDTAAGKSWEAWVAKKESQRRAEAEQAAAAAQARGHV